MIHYHRLNFLAIYLILIGVFQLILYSLISLSDSLGGLFYFDPRFGLFFLETIVRGVEHMPAALDWISAIIILIIGFCLLKFEWLLPAYFIVEFLLAAPSFLSFLLIVLINMSPNHGFSVWELPIPILVFVFVTVVPMVIGIRVYLSSGEVDSMDFIPK